MIRNQDKYKLTYSLIILILILNLFVTYLLKYSNQGMNIYEFSLMNPGNFINLIFILILITGITLMIFREEVKEYTRTIVSLTIIVNILLVLSAIINYINLPLPDYYVYDYHISRVVVGVTFFMYQFMLLVFISTVWLFIMGYSKYLFLRTVINSLFIMVLLFVFSVLYLNLNNRSSEIGNDESENVGVVLGAAVWRNKPSPSLSSRADKAAKLLSEGKIDRIQLTGSNAPGELSESQMAFNYLSSKKIDMSKVDVESRTTSTNEQIKYIKTNLYSKPGIGEVVIISDSYHLSRIKEICRFQNMNVSVVSSDLIHSFRDRLYYNFREAAGIIIFWLFAL